MTPIPTKLREAIVRARAEGLSYEEIASMLGVGYFTVHRILRLHRETSAVVPRPRGGGNVSPIHGKIEALLRSIVEEMPDATVAELTAALMAKSKTTTSRSGVLSSARQARLLAKKKSFIAVERDTPENRAQAPQLLLVPDGHQRRATRLHRRIVL